MKKKASIRRFIAIFLLGLMLGLSSTVLAGTTTSSWGYYGPYSGYSYKNQAQLDCGTYLAWSTVRVRTQNGGDVPTGYMGAQAYLYLNDAVTLSTSMQYNSLSTNNWNAMTAYSDASGTYHAEGKTAAFNGNGYNYYYTFVTPSQNIN